ncbi:MAG: PKD domain-containing protein [Bacteroidota bacterium]
MKKIIVLLFIFYSQILFAQLSVSIQFQINTVCDGNPCNYQGSSILINEVMLTPSFGDGSMYDLDNTRRGEWIELYNPDLCKSIDISCYYLGNNTNELGNSGSYVDMGGGYRIPNNTIVPPGGFVVIRGANVSPVPSNLLVQNGGKTIELIVDSSNVCLGGGNRLWFPNSGGWFAFYDKNGIPQDAISWNNNFNSCMSCEPCISSCNSCSNVPNLPSYNVIPQSKKNYITSSDPSSYQDLSWRRIPDGGAWSLSASINTMGNCNANCNTMPPITCNGTAKAIVSGGTPPYTFLWNDPQAFASSTATGLCEGNFCVTVTDASNVEITKCVDILNFEPTVSYNGIDTFCLNAVSSIISNGFSPSGGTLSGSGISGNVFNPSIAGVGTHNITYYYQDINTCSTTFSQTLNVMPIPNADAGPSQTVCKGESAKLTATGGNSYLWDFNNSPTSSITIPQINSSSIYNVTVSDSYCSNTDAVTISVVPLAEAGPNQTICKGDNAILVGTGYSNSSFEWNTIPISNIAAISVLPQDTTTYILTVTNQFCSSKDSVTVFVKPLPIAEAGENKTICKGDSLVLNASGGGEYLWSENLGTAASILVAPNNSKTYIITVTLLACKDIDSVKVFVNPLPDISMTSIDEACNKSNGAAIASVNNSIGVCHYLWNNGDTTSTSTELSKGLYIITITDAVTTCSNVDSISVYNIPGPDAYFSVSNHNPEVSEESVGFFDHSDGNVNSWFWSVEGQKTDNNSSCHYVFQNTGVYTISLLVTDANGCVDIYIDSVNVHFSSTFYIPNAFSPNGDGINELFGPEGENISYDDYQMFILNRWGNVLFSTNDFNEKWNGTKNNKGKLKDAIEDVYVYKIQVRGDKDVIKEYVGNVVLIK